MSRPTVAEALAVALDLFEEGADAQIDEATAARLAPLVAALMPKLRAAGGWERSDGRSVRKSPSGEVVCDVRRSESTTSMRVTWQASVFSPVVDGQRVSDSFSLYAFAQAEAERWADKQASAAGWSLVPSHSPLDWYEIQPGAPIPDGLVSATATPEGGR